MRQSIKMIPRKNARDRICNRLLDVVKIMNCRGDTYKSSIVAKPFFLTTDAIIVSASTNSAPPKLAKLRDNFIDNDISIMI